MNRKGDLLPDLLNEVFDLPIDWEFCRDEREISIDVLKEFSRLASEIARLTADPDYHAAISFLWSVRRYVVLEKYNNSEIVGTSISGEQSKKIMEYLKYSEKQARNAFAPSAKSGPELSSIILHKDRDKIFEIFLRKERVILRNWGLNQQSVEIVIQRVRSYRFRVFLNLAEGGSLRSDAVANSCLALQSLSRAPLAIHAGGRRGRDARSSMRPKLIRAKDKVVGIATLFGDAAPLVWGNHLDLASWFSTSLGATAMALLPRGEPKF